MSSVCALVLLPSLDDVVHCGVSWTGYRDFLDQLMVVVFLLVEGVFVLLPLDLLQDRWSPGGSSFVLLLHRQQMSL